MSTILRTIKEPPGCKATGREKMESSYPFPVNFDHNRKRTPESQNMTRKLIIKRIANRRIFLLLISGFLSQRLSSPFILFLPSWITLITFRPMTTTPSGTVGRFSKRRPKTPRPLTCFPQTLKNLRSRASFWFTTVLTLTMNSSRHEFSLQRSHQH
jgi:hypothetical protein